MTFSEQVLAARAELNMTQKAFGEMLGVKLLTISRWERGETRPRRKDFVRFYFVCKKLGLDMIQQGETTND